MTILNPQAFINTLAQVIYDKKGTNIFALDLRSTSSFFKYLIIAEGNVDRHVKALAKHVIEEAEKLGVTPYMMEGSQEGDWIVIDFVDVVVHLFISDMREKYALEELWREGHIMDLNIVVDYKVEDA